MVERKVEGPVARIVLSRPEVGNAFDPATIDAMVGHFRALNQDPSVRVAVLSGEGKHFCLGADLSWMRASANQKKSQNHRDALALHALMLAAYRFEKPLIARVQGGVYGGGVGLAACADVVVAAQDAAFCLSETKLGLVPAVIAPFLLRKLGASRTRAMGLSARTFTATQAQAWGLVHEVVPAEGLDAAVDAWASDFLAGSTEAHQNFKGLLWNIDAKNISMSKAKTTRAIVRAKSSKDGREGMSAFLEKRDPAWRVKR